YTMPKVDAVFAPRSLDWSVVNGERYSVALSQRHNFSPALHARTLLGNDKLSPGEVALRFRQQNRNLKRTDEICVNGLVQTIKVTLHILQKQRSRSVLTLTVAYP